MIRMNPSADHPKWLKVERVDDISRRYFMAVISGVNEAALLLINLFMRLFLSGK
jgi:hypothetical protein